MAAAARYAMEQTAPSLRTVVACNSNPMPQLSEKGLPEAAGLDDRWHELVVWKSRTAQSAHWAVYTVCKFVEA